MLKIMNYGISKTIENGYIQEFEIEQGMKLRIEGNTLEVEELLKSIKYEVISEGHETKNNKRVYIEVLPTEIEIEEVITNKEFKTKIIRAEKFRSINGFKFEEVELKTIIWHTYDGLYGEIYLINSSDDELLDIAYINGKDIYKVLDTEENTKNIIKSTKKALIKYKKWCEKFNIKVNTIEECTL